MTDTEYECPVGWCAYTNNSKRGLGVHFGNAHAKEEKQAAYLDELKRLADEIGRSPRRDDMIESGKFSAVAYQNQFGSWNEALQEAELEPNLRMNISTIELADELHRLADELGRIPRSSDMDKLGKFHSNTYRRHFENWKDALWEAGLIPMY